MTTNAFNIMQIIMVTLKLLNKIDLSWGMVFIPLYIEIGLLTIKETIEYFKK
jgi:hypothetical protein